MIIELSAENFALFDRFSLELGPGFNVFTGETGSGKSILIGSIQFLMGEKSPKNLVKDPQCDLVVQALFDWEDFDEFVPVVRVFTPRGKSKVYINGRFSTLDALLKLLKERVELYSQNSFGILFTAKGYLDFIDGFLPDGALDPYKDTFREFMCLKDELSLLKEKLRGAKERVSGIKAFLSEFEALSPEPGELERLKKRREVLRRAKEISDVLMDIKRVMFDGDGSIVTLLGRLQKRLVRLGELDPAFSRISSMISDMVSIASDVERDVDGFLSGDLSHEALEDVEERYHRLKSLVLKYGGPEEDLASRAEAMKEELSELSSLGDRVRELELELERTRERVLHLAGKLSSMRREVASDLEEKIKSEMNLLGFGGGRCRFSFSRTEPGPHGIDDVDLLYSPSSDVPFRSFGSVASGGERSRMALILKVLSSGRGAGTVILDEVDSGVGGRASLAVGERLKALGSKCQVLCVTHFPQVASLADRHFLVEKGVEGGITKATVRPLSFEERVSEISRMALGDDAAKDVARRFLEERIQSEEGNTK